MKNVAKDFASDTTLHGIGPAARGRHFTVKIFWILAFTGAMAYFVINFVAIVTRYRDKPLKITMKQSKRPLPFPAVTICPSQGTSLEGHYRTFNRVFPGRFPAVKPGRLEKIITDYIGMLTIVGNYYKPRIPEVVGDFESWFVQTKFLAILDDKDIKTFGVPLNQFLLASYYRTVTHKEIVANYTKLFVDNQYSNCYTVDMSNKTGSKSGIENGLALYLVLSMGNVDFNIVTPPIGSSLLSSEEGARVIVHESGSEPLPHSTGFSIAPGQSVTMGIRAQHHQKIRDCNNEDPITWKRIKYTKKYQQPVCSYRDIQYGIVKKCGCQLVLLPLIVPRNVTQYCNNMEDFDLMCYYTDYVSKNETFYNQCVEKLREIKRKIKCADEYNEKYQAADIPDKCKAPCNEVQYQIAYGTTNYPIPAASPAIYSFVRLEILKSLNDKATSELTKQLFYKYILLNETNPLQALRYTGRVVIYIEEDRYTEVKEEEEYGFPQFFSDIGGTMGLCLGASVLTLGELLLLLYQLVHRMLFRDSSSKTKVEDLRV